MNSLNDSVPAPTTYATRVLPAIAAVILTVVLGAWLALPTLAPGFTVRLSPFASSALSAAYGNDALESIFLQRVRAWDAAAVPALIDGLQSSDKRKRLCAARGLVVYADGRALEALAGGLGDSDPMVRRECARALGGISEPNAVSASIKALSDADVNTRLAAIESLGRLRDPDTIDQLKYFVQDKDRETRLAAAKSMGSIGDGKAVEFLLPLLKDPATAVAAINALGAIGDERAIGALIKVVQGPDESLSLSACNSLQGCSLKSDQAQVIESVVSRRLAEMEERHERNPYGTSNPPPPGATIPTPQTRPNSR